MSEPDEIDVDTDVADADADEAVHDGPDDDVAGSDDAAAEFASGAVRPRERTIVLVAGSGRSGTSLFAGALKRLGFEVPQPEVPADDSNPRGFAESQWVVDFHGALLKSIRVQTADARPTAWTLTAELGNEAENTAALRIFLKEQFSAADHLVVKDPRLSWFMPMWRRCADDFAVQPRFVTMLRHPAAVIDSKSRYYGNWQGDVGRAAGWVNGMLFTERATREAPRAFVRYEDLLDDWTQAISRVGEKCDLSVIRNASATSIRKVHQFIDPSLSRSSSSWDDLRMPSYLRDLCEEVWQLLNSLADDDTDVAKVSAELDEARAAYLELYTNAAAIAQSSIAAARKPIDKLEAAASKSPTVAAAMAEISPGRGTNPITGWIPGDLRKRVPEKYRRRMLRSIARMRARLTGKPLPEAPTGGRGKGQGKGRNKGAGQGLSEKTLATETLAPSTAAEVELMTDEDRFGSATAPDMGEAKFGNSGPG